ncbi:hypothetical protein [Sphaerisporangium fuscum]|uniref:hypothetical protein n=1 Tax=Sphaerisporangium fuscum TaxID=2835868 RepID=UPI001BDD3C40|nr:hypothetical protein [Sphaerisporangium fuscum]
MNGPHPGGSPGTARHDDPPPAGIPFRRLLAVETRKLFDTRGSMLMTALLVVMTVVFVAGRGTVAGPRLHMLTGTAGIGYGTLLPVLGILTVTGEWAHRTALVTFALEPRRVRVLAAKCVPPLVLAVVASLFAALAGVAATAVTARLQGVPAVWDLPPLALLGWTAGNVLVVATGLAMGMLLTNAPAAIVICLSVPMLGSLVARLGGVGEVLAGWLDLGTTSAPLAAGTMTGGEAARLAVSVLLWIVAPTAVGMARAARRDIA